MNIFLFILLVLMPVIGVALAARTLMLLQSGVRVTGQVVGYQRDEVPGPLDREYSSRDLPIVTFRDEQGKVQRVTLKEERPDDEKAIPLVYPRGLPQRARVMNLFARFLVPGILIGPAFVVAVVLGAMIAWVRIFG